MPKPTINVWSTGKYVGIKRQNVEGGKMIDIVCINGIEWKKRKEKSTQRFKESFGKFREALEQDAKEAAARGSGLPKDWRNRILK